MPYALRFIKKDAHLAIRFSGNFIKGDIEDLWKQISEYLQENPQQRILVEEIFGSTAQELDAFEIFQAAEKLSKSKFAYRLKIALLYAKNVSDETLSKAQFGETVALNRGLNLRVFREKRNAQKWLLTE